MWEGVEVMTVVKWCVSGARDLRFIGSKFHKWEDELRNEQSAKLEPGGHRWKGEAEMLRGTSSAGRFDIYEPDEVFGSDVWRR